MQITISVQQDSCCNWFGRIFIVLKTKLLITSLNAVQILQVIYFFIIANLFTFGFCGWRKSGTLGDKSVKIENRFRTRSYCKLPSLLKYPPSILEIYPYHSRWKNIVYFFVFLCCGFFPKIAIKKRDQVNQCWSVRKSILITKKCFIAFKSCNVYNTSNSAVYSFGNDVRNESFLSTVAIDNF